MIAYHGIFSNDLFSQFFIFIKKYFLLFNKFHWDYYFNNFFNYFTKN